MAEEYFSSGVLRKLFSRHAFFPRHYSLFTFLYQTGKSFLQYIYIYQRKYGGKNSNIRTVCSSIFVSCRTKLTASYYFYVYSILFGGKCGYFFFYCLRPFRLNGSVSFFLLMKGQCHKNIARFFLYTAGLIWRKLLHSWAMGMMLIWRVFSTASTLTNVLFDHSKRLLEEISSFPTQFMRIKWFS